MLTNLKIGARLALAFGIVLALLATLSIMVRTEQGATIMATATSSRIRSASTPRCC